MSRTAEPPLICPACRTTLPRLDLVRHLWTEHRLVLVGETAHQPWQLLRDWTSEYRRGRDGDLLERCRTLARESDPEHGMERLERLLLEDRHPGERSLEEEARSRRASICPQCYGLVKVPDDRPLHPLNVSHGRITGGGFRIEVRDGLLFTKLELETPAGFMHRGPEPGRRLTWQGALLVLAGPWVVLALVFGLAGAYFELPTLVPIMLALGLGLLFAAGASLGWYANASPFERALEHAWAHFVPRLLRDSPAGFEEFIAGLALLSTGVGDPKRRFETLQHVLEHAEPDHPRVPWSPAARGAVHRLAVDDAARMDVDPVPMLITQVSRFFDGELPRVFAETLLQEWQTSAWEEAARIRVRVLLSEQAFEAGCEVKDLVELGERSPNLAAALGTDRANELAALRLLWSLRASVPWSACGAADLVFDLAVSPQLAAKHFRRQPDVLLALHDLPRSYLSASGVIIAGIRITEMPASIEVRPRPNDDEFALFIDTQLIPFSEDPSPLLPALERWLAYYFREFRPRLAEVFGWRSPTGLAVGRMTVACPACGQALVPQIGAIGTRR